jgi:hypothetical protein
LSSSATGDTAGGYTLLYVFGSGRSGSTLLDRLLGGHPQVLALGELSTLVTRFDPLAATNLRDDAFAGEVRQFWMRVRGCCEAGGQSWAGVDLTHPRLRQAVRWPRSRVDAWARRNQLVIDCARRHAPARVVTDSSKAPPRLVLLARSDRFRLRLRVLHLLRDGRAVAQSYVRRYDNFAGGLRTWMIASLSAPALRRLVGSDRWLRLRYEDLAQDPARSLARVCTFVGLDYDPAMLRFRSHPYLGVRGSPTVRRTAEQVIRLDERWRSEMSVARRAAFAVVGGWLNKLYGY